MLNVYNGIHFISKLAECTHTERVTLYNQYIITYEYYTNIERRKIIVIKLTVMIKIRTQPLTTQYVHHGDRSTSFFTVYTSEKNLTRKHSHDSVQNANEIMVAIYIEVALIWQVFNYLADL